MELEKETTSAQGFDEQLAKWAVAFVWLGLVTCLTCLIAAGYVHNEYSFEDWGDNGISGVWVAIGIGALIQCIVFYLHFKGLAVIIGFLAIMRYRDDEDAYEEGEEDADLEGESVEKSV